VALFGLGPGGWRIFVCGVDLGFPVASLGLVWLDFFAVVGWFRHIFVWVCLVWNLFRLCLCSPGVCLEFGGIFVLHCGPNASVWFCYPPLSCLLGLMLQMSGPFFYPGMCKQSTWWAHFFQHALYCFSQCSWVPCDWTLVVFFFSVVSSGLGTIFF